MEPRISILGRKVARERERKTTKKLSCTFIVFSPAGDCTTSFVHPHLSRHKTSNRFNEKTALRIPSLVSEFACLRCREELRRQTDRQTDWLWVREKCTRRSWREGISTTIPPLIPASAALVALAVSPHSTLTRYHFKTKPPPPVAVFRFSSCLDSCPPTVRWIASVKLRVFFFTRIDLGLSFLLLLLLLWFRARESGQLLPFYMMPLLL